MAILGVIHRAAFGLGPEQIRKYFVLSSDNVHSTGRNHLRRHDKQLQTYRTGHFLQTTAFSILGLIDVYNLLPSGITETTDVHIFQAKLQALLMMHAASNDNRENLYSPRYALHMHPLAILLNGVSSIHIKDALVDECVTDMHPLTKEENHDVLPAW